MKEKNWVVFLGIVIVVMVFGFTAIFSDSKDVKDKDKNTDMVDGDSDIYISKDKIDDIMSGMSLEEKIGQMLVVTFNGTDMNDSLRSLMQDVKPGGIILMGDNYSTVSRTKKLISEFKSLSSVPLIVSTDQEGGRVQRMQKITDVKPTYITDMYSLGNTKDETLAYQVGKVMALEMRTLGINVDNAPVLDVYSNPNNTVIGDRSFGSDVNLVSRMGLSLAKGLEDNGVIPTFKHFPGHGDTETDSHSALPIINKSYEELSNLELMPFKSVIANGAKIIMTAHIALPDITGDNTPASLSKKILTDILRDDLGYDGLIITDGLNMKSLTDNYSNEDVYLKAVDAGVDLLLMPKDPELAIKTIKDNFSEDRINESVRRILEFKYNYLTDYQYTDSSILGSNEHNSVINKINEKVK